MKCSFFLTVKQGTASDHSLHHPCGWSGDVVDWVTDVQDVVGSSNVNFVVEEDILNDKVELSSDLASCILVDGFIGVFMLSVMDCVTEFKSVDGITIDIVVSVSTAGDEDMDFVVVIFDVVEREELLKCKDFISELLAGSVAGTYFVKISVFVAIVDGAENEYEINVEDMDGFILFLEISINESFDDRTSIDNLPDRFVDNGSLDDSVINNFLSSFVTVSAIDSGNNFAWFAIKSEEKFIMSIEILDDVNFIGIRDEFISFFFNEFIDNCFVNATVDKNVVSSFATSSFVDEIDDHVVCVGSSFFRVAVLSVDTTFNDEGGAW